MVKAEMNPANNIISVRMKIVTASTSFGTAFRRSFGGGWTSLSSPGDTAIDPPSVASILVFLFVVGLATRGWCFVPFGPFVGRAVGPVTRAGGHPLRDRLFGRHVHPLG